MRRKRMTEDVRTLLPDFRYPLEIFFDDNIDSPGIQPLSLCGEENSVHFTAACRTNQFLSRHKVPFKSLMRFLSKWKNPLLIPFADDLDRPLVHVDVVRIELNELSPPHSCAVQQFEDGSIAGTERIAGIGQRHQFFYGEFVEELREPLFNFRRYDIAHRIRGEKFSANSKFKKRTERRNLSDDAFFGHAAVEQNAKKRPDDLLVDVLRMVQRFREFFLEEGLKLVEV